MPSLLEDPTTKIPAPSAAVQGAMKLTPRKTQTPGSNHTNAPSTPITLHPITQGAASLPAGLVRFLHEEFSKEIQRGTTYPMETALSLEGFAEYWFGTFGVVALVDDGGDGLKEGRDWERVCLGAFYIKPNYPGLSLVFYTVYSTSLVWALLMIVGRCSHVCNAGFLTTVAARGKGVGVAMGETYLDFAPKLVFLPCPLSSHP